MVRPRTTLPHPDEDHLTRRMPYEQLRALVIMLVESDPDDDVDDPASEFESQPTTYRGSLLSRTSTLDQLIASLRAAAPPPQRAAPPRNRRRA